jgi:hypothetical protein
MKITDPNKYKCLCNEVIQVMLTTHKSITPPDKYKEAHRHFIQGDPFNKYKGFPKKGPSILYMVKDGAKFLPPLHPWKQLHYNETEMISYLISRNDIHLEDEDADNHAQYIKECDEEDNTDEEDTLTIGNALSVINRLIQSNQTLVKSNQDLIRSNQELIRSFQSSGPIIQKDISVDDIDLLTNKYKDLSSSFDDFCNNIIITKSIVDIYVNEGIDILLQEFIKTTQSIQCIPNSLNKIYCLNKEHQWEQITNEHIKKITNVLSRGMLSVLSEWGNVHMEEILEEGTEQELYYSKTLHILSNKISVNINILIPPLYTFLIKYHLNRSPM